MSDHPQNFVELLVFEDLCNVEGSLQAKKKLKKTLEFKFKTVNDLKVSGNFFNFSSFKKKNQLIDFSIFITLYKNMMIQ